jgi:hypothetical protein
VLFGFFLFCFVLSTYAPGASLVPLTAGLPRNNAWNSPPESPLSSRKEKKKSTDKYKEKNGRQAKAATQSA